MTDMQREQSRWRWFQSGGVVEYIGAILDGPRARRGLVVRVTIARSHR
jgi:hypothetical protein